MSCDDESVGPTQPSAQDVLELTLWCQRLATMIHRCCQPTTLFQDVESRLQEHTTRLDAAEYELHCLRRAIEDGSMQPEVPSEKPWPRKGEDRKVRLTGVFNEYDAKKEDQDGLMRKLQELMDRRLKLFEKRMASAGVISDEDLDLPAIAYKQSGNCIDADIFASYIPRPGLGRSKLTRHGALNATPEAIAVTGDITDVDLYESGLGTPPRDFLEIPDGIIQYGASERSLMTQDVELHFGYGDSHDAMNSFDMSDLDHSMDPGQQTHGPAMARRFSQSSVVSKYTEYTEETDKRLAEIEQKVEEVLGLKEKAEREQSGHFTLVEVTPDAEDLKYEFGSSIWDASMLLFFHTPPELRIGSYTDRLAILVTYLSNGFMQSLLILSIFLGMLDNPYPDCKIDEINKWRATALNQTLTTVTSAGARVVFTTADLVCNHALWSWEQQEFEDLFDYTRPIFNYDFVNHEGQIPGKWLSALCTCVWVCCIFHDYEISVMHLRGLTCMPRGAQSILTITADGVQVESAHFFTRLGIFIFIICPRLCVQFSLLYVGCKWISHTIVFEDLLINCVALMFVLDMDETLYIVILPIVVRRTVESINPIPLTRVTLMGDVEIADLVRWVLMGMVLVSTYVVWTLPFKETLEQAATSLCPGSLANDYHPLPQVEMCKE